MPLILVTGPVRSGKSAFAARLAEESGLPVTYVATAARDPHDAEMEERIRRHQRERPAAWRAIETGDLTEAQFYGVLDSAPAGHALLIDSLGTLLAAKLYELREVVERDAVRAAADVETWAARCTSRLSRAQAHTIVISEQVGWDVVPVAPSARIFRDALGRMQQHLAIDAASIYLIIAGIAVDLRRLGATP